MDEAPTRGSARWRTRRGCSSATATTRPSTPPASSPWPTPWCGGLEVILDQYVHPAPDEGWPLWMDTRIDEANFVLMVCTEAYRRRVMRREEPEGPRGGLGGGA